MSGAFPFPLRLAYLGLIGWWLSLAWMLIAWAAAVSVVGLPLSQWMLNRLPQVLLAQPLRGNYGEIITWEPGALQLPWPWRLAYVLLIGWWVGLLWTLMAWALCVTILGLPFGILALNQLPSVTTLRKLR